MRSELVVHDPASGAERIVHRDAALIEAPNWSPDGNYLVFNGGGLVYRISSSGGEPQRIDTGFACNCNNDHGISPDGSLLALSDSSRTGNSCIYTIGALGGEPSRVTENVPSWWHGWSPDGGQLAYTAMRDGRYYICTVRLEGGEECRVAGGDGTHYDGPDYTADGAWIWFNSSRSGTMQLWRMRRDGSDARQMTDDGRVNWFPHPSPDGRKVVYLAYQAGVEGHPGDRDVELRMMNPEGGGTRVLARFNGGQGTINVPSWSPDGSAFAYMRYTRQ